MRRIVLGALAILGFACLTAAVGTKLFLVPQLRVVPLDLDITTVATTVAPEGQAGDRFPATLFDRCSIKERTAKTFGAHLTQQRRSRIIEPSDRRQATIQSAQTVRIDHIREKDGKVVDPAMAKAGEERTCNDALLTASVDRVSVSRKTSVPNGAVNSIQTEAVADGDKVSDASVVAKRQGFQYKFGFNVKKRDYLYYDLTTREDTRVKFVDEKVINGVKTYHFVTEVPETDLSTLETPSGDAALGTMLTMPAHWWGITGKGVKPGDKISMHRYASSTRHVWVEPQTGTIVDGREDQNQYFKSPDQSEDTPKPVRDFTLTSLKATFQWTPDTVSAQAGRAQKYLNQLRFGQDVLPLILGGAGIVLLLAWLGGVFLTGRGGGSPSRHSVDGAGVGAGVGSGVGEGPAEAPATAATTVLTTEPPAPPYGSPGYGATGPTVPEPAWRDADSPWHYNAQGQYVADENDPSIRPTDS